MNEEKVNVRAIRDEMIRLVRESSMFKLDPKLREQTISDQTSAPDLVSPEGAKLLEKSLEFLRGAKEVEDGAERKMQQIREKVASYVTDKDMIELLTAEVATKIALKKLAKMRKEEQKS